MPWEIKYVGMYITVQSHQIGLWISGRTGLSEIWTVPGCETSQIASTVPDCQAFVHTKSEQQNCSSGLSRIAAES